jgi:hypothetical protein
MNQVVLETNVYEEARVKKVGLDIRIDDLNRYLARNIRPSNRIRQAVAVIIEETERSILQWCYDQLPNTPPEAINKVLMTDDTT